MPSIIDDPKFKEEILLKLAKYPETVCERICKSVALYIMISILALTLYQWDQSNKNHEIKLKTTLSVKHKLMTKKQAGNMIFVETSRYSKMNGEL